MFCLGLGVWVILPLRYHISTWIEEVGLTTRFNNCNGYGPTLNGYKNQGTVDEQILVELEVR